VSACQQWRMGIKTADSYRRLTVDLPERVLDQLRDTATAERRSVREQAAWELEQALKRSDRSGSAY